MAGHKDSFAEKIRTAAKKLGQSFTFPDLSNAANLRSSAEEKKMKSTMKDFINRGEMARIAPGEYRYVGRQKDKAEIEKRRVMWSLLKMRRIVSVEDLQELAGVSKDYALEWLLSLVKNEAARKITPANPTLPCRWQLIKDVDVMPEDEARKKKYRDIRRKNKEALGRVLDHIQAGVNKARGLVEDI